MIQECHYKNQCFVFPSGLLHSHSCLYKDSTLAVKKKYKKVALAFSTLTQCFLKRDDRIYHNQCVWASIRHQRGRFKQKWNAYWDERVCSNHSQSCITHFHVSHKPFCCWLSKYKLPLTWEVIPEVVECTLHRCCVCFRSVPHCCCSGC